MGLLTLAAHFPGQTWAQAFLFENVAAGDYLVSLSATAGNQTLQVTPEGYPNGSVTVLMRDGPLFQGVVGNQGASPYGNMFAPLRFTFSQPVATITFGFMDALGGSGGDIDGSVSIRGFDSANNLLGTMLYNNPSYDGGAYETLSGTFAGASYFIASTAAPPDNMNSMVYEIVGSTAVPEPSTLALFGLGFAGLLIFRRRQP